VYFITLPPLEDREMTMKSLGVSDVFGLNQRPQQYHQMVEMEKTSEDELIVMISEIYLDKPLVLEKLETLFQGFENLQVTPLYVLMGSFFSKSYFTVNGGKQIMETCFQQLHDIIVKYPLQASEAKWLFIPGPLDAGVNIVLPRKPLPEHLITPFLSGGQIKHVKFSTNPCRLRCFTKEIVLSREDILRKMQRHLVLPINKDGHENNSKEVTEILAESILDQGHLCPLPSYARPIIWELDYVMRLFPLPDLVTVFFIISSSTVELISFSSWF
jgi:DNA polymerase epsilon subunit 2